MGGPGRFPGGQFELGAGHDQRIVEEVGLGGGVLVPAAGVRVEAVGEMMLALVGIGIGVGGGAQQAETHDVVANIVAVFAVVEQRNAVAAFAEVDPFLGAGLEARPVPTGVAVGGALHVAPLDLIAGLRGQHVDREGGLEEDVLFVPVDAWFRNRGAAEKAVSEMRWTTLLLRIRRRISSTARSGPLSTTRISSAGSASHCLSS